MNSLVTIERINVSPEMAAFVGAGVIGDISPAPRDAVIFTIMFAGPEAHATIRFDDSVTHRTLNISPEPRLSLIVAREACQRVLNAALNLNDGGVYHLSPHLRAIAIAIRDCNLPDGARAPYRLAKSIELLCDTLRAHAEDALIPIGADGVLTRADSQRLLAARRLIDERWSEKLTLDIIARACGLNRAKLTRGFRDMFDCSVADAISDQRLGEAGQMLLATDLPVSSIGYKCGYLNNASFTRAFARRFGLAPTQYRAHGLAA